MNPTFLRFFRRISAAILLATICAFTFAAIRSTTSVAKNEKIFQTPIFSDNKQVAEAKFGTINDESAVAALRTEKRGYPLINLQNGKRLQTQFVGADGALDTLSATEARPQTMINSDLNFDGASELIVGYESASADSGRIAIYRGNPDSLSARTPEIFEGIKQGRFPAPFLPTARVIELPISPDFIGAGDFNRDGYKDIVVAARGANSLVLLAGNNKGEFQAQNIELPGRVTALLTENIDPTDGQPDVAVALSDSDSAWLLIFDNQHNIFAGQHRRYRLPAEATSLALGQLDDAAPMDILAAAGGKAVVIHGSYPKKNESLEATTAANAQQVEVLNLAADVAAARVGNFVWDRENRPEIALLTQSGTIQILQRGKLDTRRYSEEEFEAYLQRQEEKDRIELMRRSADPTNRANLTTNQKQQRQTSRNWTEADSFQLSSGFNLAAASSASVFTSARMTTEGIENLIVADSATRKIKVLLQNNDVLKASGESNELSAKGSLAAVELDSASTPAAVLPMRLGVMTRPGLVMVDEESGEVSYSLAAPVATFTVTKTADTYDGTCDADCSLREAVRAANLTANVADIVMVPAGTYTLTLGPSDDSPLDASAQGTGDLDIRDDLTITGAGQATTIIQAGTSPSNGIDRVLHVRQSGSVILDLSVSGVTVRNGKCDTSGSVANPNGARCNTGGAGLFVTGQDTAVFTISDSTITSNWNVATNAGTGQFFLNGAGVYIGRGDTTLNNVTVSNNENGATGSQHGGDGAGLLFGFSSATNINTVVMNNCNVTGNIARRFGSDVLGGNGGGFSHAYDDVDINGGNYSNNTAEQDGGAFHLLTITDFTNNVSITDNDANGNGGGISNSGVVGAMNNATITNNTATGSGGGILNNGMISITAPTLNNNSAGSGGGIYSAKGALSITGGTVNGNTATSGKGGGIEHKGNSASTVSSVTISNNTGSGIHITGTGSLDASNNTITGNSGDGISKIGGGTGSHFNSNVIHSNGELGIDLSDDGVTQNDTNDTDAGPNDLQNFPVLNSVTVSNDNTATANVTLNGADGSYRIQYFANAACDASGHGEGEVLLASQTVTVAGNTATFNSPALNFGTKKQITATATHDVNGDGNFDNDGNTSEFSACRVANAQPTIAAGAGISRQQGSPVSNSQIASVADSDQTVNTLSVTVNNGSSATVSGVTVSGIAVNATGNVTANVVASCSASSNASFTLRVTDAEGAFSETPLNVTVNSNTAPTIGDYPNTNVSPGGNTTVTPDAAPADNGSIQSATATAAGFTGTLSVNSTTGVVTVSNANPPGVYTVSVNFTDNCGSASSKQFTLRVNAPPTANPENYSTNEDTALSVTAPGVLQNDTDPDQGDTLTAVLVSGPANAQSFALNSNGSFSYTPAADFNGSDSFTYKARDNNNADSSPVTVVISVNSVNDAPSFVSGGNVSVAEDSGAYNATWATAISKGAANENGQTVGFIITNNTNPALFSSAPAIAPNGALSFTPAANAFGNAVITVVLKDDGGTLNGGADTSAPVNFTIIVTPVNDPPTVQVVAGGSCSNGGLVGTVNLVVNDVDNDASVLTLSGSSSNTGIVPNSNIVFGGTGANRTMTITPLAENNLPNSLITITVSDGYAGTGSTIVNVIVGANGTQTIFGSSGDDMIFGFNGGDTINGGAGKDLVCGGNGNDTMIGGEGDDTLVGDHGNDVLRGEDGNDVLTGGSGADSFSGGSGTDSFTDFNPTEGDTTDNTFAMLGRVLEGGGNWTEE